MEKIFHEFFENARNISDLEVLFQIGLEILGDSVSPEQLREFLSSNKHAETVTQLLSTNPGVKLIPHFYIYIPNSNRK